ncbi:MAG: cbb3-type cytochrome c oxidase subunit 3 [Phycisphaerales bacterium]|nr:cbb3-type cytochrome c oxidase subunit 3 [Phycisphaerales bacterium]
MLATLAFVEIALIIFFTVFIGVLLWVVLRRRGAFDHVARIPLDDDPPALHDNTPPSSSDAGSKE